MFSKKIYLDIGCGDNKSKAEAYGLDVLIFSGVDVVCNFEKGLPIKSNIVDAIYSRHTLEHIENLEFLLQEFLRIVKKGGQLHIVVPHFSNSLGYSDYTHKRFFGLYTFDYFSSD